MFPIELNQGGNYLIIRLCLTRPCREKLRAGERRRETERGERGGGGVRERKRNIESKCSKTNEWKKDTGENTGTN